MSDVIQVPEVDLLPEEAAALTDQIRESVADLEKMVVRAYLGRVWIGMGYESWDDYVQGEFKRAPLALPREERRVHVASLRSQGLSTRAIASATGTDKRTVGRDLAGGANAPPERPDSVLGTDGKQYQPTRKVTERESHSTTVETPTNGQPDQDPASTRRRPLPDQFFDAAYDLARKVESVHRLTQDDRFTDNVEEVAAKHRNDLLAARDLLQQVLDRLQEG